MKKLPIALGLILIVMGCISTQNTETYLGGFEETEYPFLNSIFSTYDQDKSAYIDAIFREKFASARHLTGDETLVTFGWARNPSNMKVLYRTLTSIGLSRFISKEDYFHKPFDICCGKDWKDSTLNQIVGGFLSSDTAQRVGEDYFTKFWNRRRAEGNLGETYEILTDIHGYYTQPEYVARIHGQVNDTIKKLLSYDLSLMEADSIQREGIVLAYFHYLNEINLKHSAYDLLKFEERDRRKLKEMERLVTTLEPDTLDEDVYYMTRYNSDGWIRFGYGK